ncbi:DUF624 domain-containing protein, partial [bacterium]|nr:DUF624 domain-containing protein [bacterium]
INKKAFWNNYDNLGRLIVINFGSLILGLSIIGLPLAIYGLFKMAHQIANYEPISLREYADDFPKQWKKFTAIALILIFAVLILLSNIYFYNSIVRHPEVNKIISLFAVAMLGLTVWLLVFFFILLCYLLPGLFEFSGDIRHLFRNSFFLMMDNLQISAYLFFSVLLWLVVGIVSGALIFMISVSIIAVMDATAVREVLSQYSETDLVEEEEQRGFRDLIRPWSNQ